MPTHTGRFLVAVSTVSILLFAPQPAAHAQAPDQSSAVGNSPTTESEADTNTLGKNYLKHLVADQRSFWTSPTRDTRSKMKVIIPFAAMTAGLLASDADLSKQLSRSPSRINTSNNIANYGLAAMVAGGGGMYLFGRFGHDEHARETGVLASEAAINSVVIAEVVKLATQRQRPNEGTGKGHFWEGGSSFPSEHAMISWSLAAVISNEYPSPAIKLLSYGAASAISLSRVTSLNHFPSDVFVGSTLGYLVGREVYKTRRDGNVAQANYGTFVRSNSNTQHLAPLGTTFVPLDSWVYPLLDKLAGMGYIDSAFVGQRPWSRQECARLVKEGYARMQAAADSSPWVESAYRELDQEFAPELHDQIDPDFDGRVESAYARVLGISGSPLTNGFDFGQTIINDFGRPFGEGFNGATGVSTRFVIGPFSGYVRGEYQHAAQPMNLSPAVQSEVLNYNAPAAPAGSPWMIPQAQSTDKFRFLDTYLSANFRNFLFTFGKQSLWWGPDKGGPALFSNNAQPIPMFRVSRNNPLKIPWVSKILGPLDVEVFLGQLGGYQYVTYVHPNGQMLASGPPVQPHPWIHGEKLTFKPTPNFEFGFGETTIFGGPGYGFTGHTLLRSYSISNTLPGQPDDPGDRRSAFDFSYRIPGVRNWLTFYADSFAEDEFSPIAYPRRSAWWMGFYMPKIPKLNKLELRAEGGYTDLPGLINGAGQYYTNSHYNSGYTNFGQLMGNWVGKQGRGIQAWSTYRFSARNSLEASFRKEAANPHVLGGGTIYDGRLGSAFMLKPDLELTGYLQYERWHYPMLFANSQSNVAIAIQINYLPLGGMTAGKILHALEH